MSDIQNNEYTQDLNKLFPQGLNNDQVAYIGALHDEISILSQQLYGLQNNLAKWMLSQKACKEVAIQLGLKNGMSVEEVLEKTISVKLDVLESRNDVSHGTNAKDSNFLNHKVEELKLELEN